MTARTSAGGRPLTMGELRRAGGRLWRDVRGQASIELLGFVPLLLLAAMAAWQLQLAASAANYAKNAARTASRTAGLGGDPVKAAMRSLPDSQKSHAKITVNGQRVTVKTDVPTIVPGLTSGLFHVSGTAELPATTAP